LNTPDVLFADIDFDSEIKARSVLFRGAVLAVMAALLALWQRSGAVALIAGFLALVISYPFALLTHKIVAALSGGPEKQAYSRIHSFLKRNPEWHLRLYRTPSGLRVLVMHRSFDPLEPRVKGFFDSLGVDPVYAAMCKNQKCFRARVSPKPWRIGIATHMRPRPGVWPVRPEHMENRRSWVLHYETQATKFASCRFLETLGGSSVVKKAEQVCALHDKLSQAQSGREIA
jgi:hypothetical protein